MMVDAVTTTPGTGYGRVSTETMRSIVSSRKTRRSFWQQLALIGPAFVAGAWQFGPGNLTTAVQAGSGYQYALIWVIVVSTILVIFLTEITSNTATARRKSRFGLSIVAPVAWCRIFSLHHERCLSFALHHAPVSWLAATVLRSRHAAPTLIIGCSIR